MNSSIRLAALALLAACLAGSGCRPDAPVSALPAARYAIGLSPYLPHDAKDEVFRRIVAFVIDDAPAGSSIGIYDAFHNRTVARIDIPTTRAFASPKTRATQFKEQIGQLKAFLAKTPPRPERDGWDFAEAVRLPQFLAFLADNLPEDPKPTRVLVVGSPLYLDDQEASFSMAAGYFPSDGHLLAPRESSVYSTEGKSEALKGASLSIGWLGEPWENEIHAERIRRFWSLYAQEQGGRLASFAGDLATVFSALTADSVSTNRYTMDPVQARVEMLRISREIDATDWIASDLSGKAPAPPPTRETGPMKIGIRWSGDIDLDLYARASPESPTLSFQNDRSEAGFFYKDHRLSPDREYEFIEFPQPIDCRAAEAWVNFFDGKARGPVSGEVRIEFEGRIYARPFALAAAQGNQGRAGAGQSAHWTRLAIPEILKLPKRAANAAAAASSAP